LTALWLVLPAFDEERALPPLLERCRGAARLLAAGGTALHVLVVDDGSRDGTAAAARAAAGSLALEVLEHSRNRGLGAALRTGLEAALARAADTDGIAVMDADDTHDPGLLPALRERLEAEGADVAIASRYAPGARETGMPAARRLLSRGASALLALTLRVAGARDYSCGYRLYRAATLRRAAGAWGGRLIEESEFTCTAEVLVKLGRGGARVTEVPLVLRYDRKGGPSKMRVGRTVRRYFAMVARLRRSPIPRVVD
jgi:dolichol-phosphate mannosyltransferase